MAIRLYQAITSCLQFISILLIAFSITDAPVLAEMPQSVYIDTLLKNLKSGGVEKLEMLVHDNPETTQRVIQWFEIEANRHVNEEDKDFFNSGASLLMLTRAQVLANEGISRYRDSDFRGAIEMLEAALAIYQKLVLKKEIVEVVMYLGRAYSVLGDQRKAISFYEKGLAIAEEIDDKQQMGYVLNNLGNAYIFLEEPRKAICFLEKALAIAEEIGDKERKASVLGDLGCAYFIQCDYEKTISFCESSLTIAEEIGDKGIKTAALVNLGNVYLEFGDDRKAISFYEKVLAVAEEIGDKLSIGASLGNQGNVYNNSCDYRNAISFYKKALAIQEEIGNKNGMLDILHNLGSTYRGLGDYRNAISFYEKALAIAEEIGGKNGKTLCSLGSAYSGLGDYGKAFSFFEKALAISERIGDKKSEVFTLGELGRAYSDIGKYKMAISFYEKAIDINKKIQISDSSHELNIADAFLALDRDNEALSIYTKYDSSIGLGRYHLKKKEYISAKEQFERYREKDEEEQGSWFIPKGIGLGLSNEGLKDYEEAYRWYKKAIALMEEQRIANTVAEREHYFEGKVFCFPRIEAYEGAVRSATMLGRFDEAFYWAENTRGRVTSELLSSRHSGSNAKIAADLAKEEDSLTTQIMTNKKQQQTAFEKNNQKLLKQLKAEYPSLKTRMDNLIDRLRKEYPQYAAIKYPQPVTLSQLALKPGETIIEYEVTDPYTIGMVIRDGKVIKSFKVDKTRKELEALVMTFRAPFQEGADIDSFSLNQAASMADLLITPALSMVRKGDRLIIVPDESLNLVPFESLLISAPAAALEEEATCLPRWPKQTESDTVDKESLIRGLSKAPATRGAVSVAPRVSTHILFDTGSAQVKDEYGSHLKEVLAALGANELKAATIRIEGHTDSVGDSKFNRRLSMKRVRAIYDYLTKNGIPAEHLHYTVKVGTEQVASNIDKKGRKQHLLVDFVRINMVVANQKDVSAKGFVYAMDEHPISYYQSASVLSLQRSLMIKRVSDKSFFGLGDPVFDNADDRLAVMRGLKIVAKDQPTAGSEIAANETTRAAGYYFGRLENTEKEIKEVGKLFDNSVLLTGVNASENKLKSEDLSSRRYLLFSTHGILGSEIPYIKQPALVLNLVNNDKEDGFLTASEILNLNLNADVVVLSACKTGLGVQSAGEGVVGLSRVFMYAGTDTVLVSLWSVDDESTYKLMVKFFEGVKGGKDKIAALKDAKNYLRTNGYENPFYWAPFILIGEAN